METNTSKPSSDTMILAIYPNHQGMGYVICEQPNEILNYGIGKFRVLSPTNYVKRLVKFIREYRPDVIILKDYDKNSNTIGKRVKKVIDSLEIEALKRDLKVYRYQRIDVVKVFSEFGETHKYGISKTLAKWYPELRRFIAPMRTFLTPESYHMGIFDAFALMHTHCVLTGLTEKQNEK